MSKLCFYSYCKCTEFCFCFMRQGFSRDVRGYHKPAKNYLGYQPCVGCLVRCELWYLQYLSFWTKLVVALLGQSYEWFADIVSANANNPNTRQVRIWFGVSYFCIWDNLLFWRQYGYVNHITLSLISTVIEYSKSFEYLLPCKFGTNL